MMYIEAYTCACHQEQVEGLGVLEVTHEPTGQCLQMLAAVIVAFVATAVIMSCVIVIRVNITVTEYYDKGMHHK